MLYEPKTILTLKHLLVGVVYLCGTVSASFGVYSLYISLNQQEIVTEEGIESQVCEKNTNFGIVTVYISGSVHNPGLYELQTGQRVHDAIALAGGVTKKVDTVYLHKHLNFAQKIEDGQQIYIPSYIETEKELTIHKVETVTSNMTSQTTGVSINTASQTELETLSGIGTVRAQAIIDNRPYSSLNELASKKVISQNLLTELEQMLIL